MHANFKHFLLTISVVALVVFFVTFANSRHSKLIEILILGGILGLIGIAYRAYKRHYAKDSAVFVPKMNGFGFSVNPNVPAGKALWFLAFGAVLVILLTTAFA